MTTQTALSPSLQPPHGLELPGPVWGLDPSTLRLAACVLHRCYRPLPAAPPGFSGGTLREGEAEFGKEAFVAVDWHTSSYSTVGGMERRLAGALRVLLP